MWFLRKLDGEIYPLYTRSKHTIGRTGTLELSTDASVSRQHASIVITLKNGIVKFVLQDLKSKYGTFLNDGIESASAMPKSTSVELRIGDQIRFGLQSNTWILEESRFVTSTSMLSSQDKSNLKSIFARIKGEILFDWNENCTHLTMVQIKTSVKAVCACAQVKPIVSVDYWKHLSKAFFGSVETPLPDCDDFIPPIAEPLIKSSLIDMKMNKNRRTIFKGFKFIVFSAALMKNISPIVEATGGTIIDGNSWVINESELCQEKVIVVFSGDEEARSSKLMRITNILNSKGLRLVRDLEIYLSIFECSTKRHSNPRFDASALILPVESLVSTKDENSGFDDDDAQDPQSIQETQFMETASGNFTLAVNERLVISDSDDDDMILGTDPSVISATPPDSMATKRKLAQVEGGVKAKHARLDSWLLNKKAADSSENSASESVLSTSKTNKKGFKELFSFRAQNKRGDRASSCLFSSSTDSSPQAASVPKDKASPAVSRTASLFALTTSKPSEAGDQRASRTAGLFAKVGAPQAGRSSGRSSASEEASTSNLACLGKRKRDEVDSGSRQGSRTASLFEKRAKRPSVVHEVADSDSDGDSEAIARKASKLTIAKEEPVYQDSPVDVPSKMSLSQFQGPPAKENIPQIKTEEGSPTKDAPDKSVICTMPLVLSDIPNIQRRSVDPSAKNFKKFRKNQVCYPSSSILNGTKLTLFSGGAENGFDDD